MSKTLKILKTILRILGYVVTFGNMVLPNSENFDKKEKDNNNSLK